MEISNYTHDKKLSIAHRIAERIPVALPGLLLCVGFASLSLAVFAAKAPSQDPGTRVFAEGLNIQLDKNSPAYAALEDIWTDSSSEMPNEMTAATSVGKVSNETLASGSTSVKPLVEKITRDNHREDLLAEQERVSREAQTRAFEQYRNDNVKKLAAQFTLHAPPPEAEAPIEHPIQTISLSSLHISREELVRGLLIPIAKSTDSNPAVAARVAAYNRAIAAQRQAAVNAPAPTFGTMTSAESLRPAADHMTTQPAATAITQDPAPGSSQAPSRQVMIAGSIEFTGGLAVANTLDRVVVFHEKDGEVVESGAVWLREGRYEIFVDEADGSLIGELRTTYGDILGRAEFDLSHFTPSQNQRTTSIPLSLHPVIQGIAGKVVGRPNPSDATKRVVKAAQVIFKDLPLSQTSRADGKFEETNLLEGSTVITKTVRSGFYGSIAFARAGTESEFEIFPDKTGHAIHELVAQTRSNESANTAGVVWGRVTKSGKAIAGAQVEILTTTEVVKPVYFNSAMLPDTSLTATSSNGLYAFFPVPAGAHAVQATVNGQVSEPLIFPAEEHNVSRVDIEAGLEREARMKVFDAFRTDWPVSAQVVAPGSSRRLTVNSSGEAIYHYADGNGLLMLDLDSGQNYERTRISLDRDRRTIFVPMVQSQWLEENRNILKINKEPNTGVAVGFVQGAAPYKVALEQASIGIGTKIVYFNNRGLQTGLDYGEPGGGFVIYNLQEGFRTVAIQPSGSTKAYAAVILVESKVTNVISHWIR